MYHVVGALEEGDVFGWSEDVGALPGDAVCPGGRGGRGGDVLPLGLSGAAGGGGVLVEGRGERGMGMRA